MISCVPVGYTKRVIVHPSFMNASFGDAEKALAGMEQGDAIFRPSSKVCGQTWGKEVELCIPVYTCQHTQVTYRVLVGLTDRESPTLKISFVQRFSMLFFSSEPELK